MWDLNRQNDCRHTYDRKKYPEVFCSRHRRKEFGKTYFQLLEGATIRIGNNCGISNSAFTCASEIVLEDNVLLGSGCKLYDTDFHALDYRERLKGNYPGAPVKTKPIIIGEGAFVGAGSFVLKGVRIGKHSIVGAGSVVSKDIPDYEIWAGNPARFIKKVEEQ